MALSDMHKVVGCCNTIIIKIKTNRFEKLFAI